MIAASAVRGEAGVRGATTVRWAPLASILLALGVSLAGIAADRSLSPAPAATVMEGARPSITFIMGADDAYYRKAEVHFRTHPVERTDAVVTDCRTIDDVLRRLDAERPGRRPWGVVNVVAHGNPWTGLALPVTEGGKRTTTAALAAAAEAGAIRRLRRGAVDGRTEIRVMGCAVGRDAALLAALSRAFAAGGTAPRVVSSEGFQVFTVEEEGGAILSTARAEKEAWFSFFPAGRRPADLRLAQTFRRTYPTAAIAWLGALGRSAPEGAGKPFSLTFDIPVEWVVRYPVRGTRPPVETREEEARWLEAQGELRAYLETLGLRAEDFTWRVTYRDVLDGDGRSIPAVRALGMTTALCVLADPAPPRARPYALD